MLLLNRRLDGGEWVPDHCVHLGQASWQSGKSVQDFCVHALWQLRMTLPFLHEAYCAAALVSHAFLQVWISSGVSP